MMSGFRPPRFPHPFSFGNNPRFPPLKPVPQEFSPRPRQPQGRYCDNRGGAHGFVPFTARNSRPRGRFPTPYGEVGSHFGTRGRGKGHHGNKGAKRSQTQSQGNESYAYYNHSMVEDPWKELEETIRKQKEDQSS